MKHLTDALRDNVTKENWYGALMIALTLPDICRRLEDPSKNSKAGYIAWYETWLSSKYTSLLGPEKVPHQFLNGSDLYALRCAYLHQGEFSTTDQVAKDALHGFTFVVPPKGWTIHCNQIEQSGEVKLQLQVDIFCEDIASAVDAWAESVKDEPLIQARIQLLGSIIFPDKDGGFSF